MTRKISAGMQAYGIGAMLAGTRWNTEMFDVTAHLDRTLTYGENRQNIRQHLGIQVRDHNLEHLQLHKLELERERQRRRDPTRQTGAIQTTLGIIMDRARHALPPGRRISRTGQRYYEYRANMSDKPGSRL